MKITLQARRLLPAVVLAAVTLLTAQNAQATELQLNRGIGPTAVNLLDFLNAARSQSLSVAAPRQQVAVAPRAVIPSTATPPAATEVSLANVIAEAQWRKEAASRLWRRVELPLGN